MGNFNHSFIRLRTNSGFKTAYNFYHSNGGRRVFPFTYAHYLKIERGGSLPEPSALAIMVKLLRRLISVQERRGLVRDYLHALSGSVAVYDELFAPLFAPTSDLTRNNALPLVIGRFATNITPAQFRTIVSSPEATGCILLFSCVSEALSIDQIAEYIGFSKEACLAAIRLLLRQKLIVARGRDRYACSPPTERVYQMPNSHGLLPLYEKMQHNIDRIARDQGEPFYGRWTSIRLHPAAVDQVTRDLNEAIDVGMAHSQKMMRPGPETPIYFIEARVRRLVAFPPDDDVVLAGPTARPGHARGALRLSLGLNK